MTIEAALRAQLLADPTVSGMVGTRIFPGRFKQGELAPGQPVITYNGPVSSVRNKALGMKSAGTGRFRWQFNAWTISPPNGTGDFTNARALIEAIRLALEGFTGLLGGAGGVLVSELSVAGERPIPDPVPEITHLTMDFFIFHQVTIPS